MVAIAIKKGAMVLKFFPGIKYKLLKAVNEWLTVYPVKTMFMGYIVLLLLVGVSFSRDIRVTLFYILLGLLFATANEAVQYLLPYRAFNINDLLANGLGVMLGSVVFIKY